MTEEVLREVRKFNETDRNLALWYLSCPYAHRDPEVVRERIALLERCYVHIMTEFNGVVPFSPVLNMIPIQEKLRIESPPEGVYAFDLVHVYRLNRFKGDRLAVLQFEDWESSVGVALEVATAEALGIKVLYYTVDQLLSDEEVPF